MGKNSRFPQDSGVKLFGWLYPDLQEMAPPERRGELLERLVRLRADGAYVMVSAQDVDEREDAIASLLSEAAEAGLEFHLGICPFSPPRHAEEGLVEKRYQYVEEGEKRYGNLCPSWPENRERAVALVRGICERFHPPGVHLDFIRYLFTNSPSFGVPLEWESGRKWIDTYPWCQCAACVEARREFVAREGFNQYDALHPAVLFKEIEFRKRNVNEVMAGIRQVTNESGAKLSIAARVQYLNRALIEGQDWVEWCRQGLVDIISHMNYSTSSDTVIERLRENLRRLAGTNVRIYDGLSKKSSAGYNSPDQFAAQCRAVLSEGVDGVSIFHFGVLEDEDVPLLAGLKEATR